MKKNIFYMMVGVLCSLFVASCSTNDQMTDNEKAGTVTFRIADFPTFDGETSSSRTVIGTYDAGKSAWTAGDEILVMVDFFEGEKKQYVTFTYTAAGTWTQTGDEVKTFSGNPNVYAYYAPSYQWSSNGQLELKTGKTAGADEFIVLKQEYSDLQDEIEIDFSQAKRSYSRLRVAAEPGSKSVTMSCAGFIPAGSTPALGTDGTLTSTVDSKNNAYFYGTWPTSSSFTIHSDVASWYEATQTVTSASVNAKSYAISCVTPAPKIGDYYFNDGSWGTLESRPSPAVPIAVVFSTTTSENDKNSGFKHGYAMALRDAAGVNPNSEPDHGDYTGVAWNQGNEGTRLRDNLAIDYATVTSKQTIDAKDGYTDCKKISENFGTIPFTKANYPALWYALNFGTDAVEGTGVYKAPKGSSGWYVPASGQWYDIVNNFKLATAHENLSQYNYDISWKDDRHNVVEESVIGKINEKINKVGDRNTNKEVLLTNEYIQIGYWIVGDGLFNGVDRNLRLLYSTGKDVYMQIDIYDKRGDKNMSVRPVIAF